MAHTSKGSAVHIRVITNTTNGVGLQRDAEIIRDVLEPCGHRVELCHFKAPPPPDKADVALFLEIIAPQYLGCAHRHWLMPNPEWFPPAWKTMLSHIDLVLCKTRQAQTIFESLRCECVFTGFMSRDLREPAVVRKRRFLHLAGKSQTKNTQALLCAWTQSMPPEAELTLVSQHYADVARAIPRVHVHERVSDVELRTLMNSHLFHLCPSGAEGWGHYIHEALGAGAVVVTTDGAPMDEIARDAVIHIAPVRHTTMGLAPFWLFTGSTIVAAVFRCLALDDCDIAHIRHRARQEYEQKREVFINALTELCLRESEVYATP